MELWRQCAGWLIQCRVLPENHRVTWDNTQVCDLAHALRDGVLLCQLLNNLLPQSVNLRQINLRPQMSQFLCLKNIRTFLCACQEKFGMKKNELFEAFDLFDVRDFAKQNVHVTAVFTVICVCHVHCRPFPDEACVGDDDIYTGLSDQIDDTVEEDDDLYDCVEEDEKEGDDIYEDLMRTEEPETQQKVEVDKRSCCLQELRQTEEKYTNTLESILQHFLKPLQPFLQPVDIENIFINIQDLAKTHRSLLHELQESMLHSRAENLYQIFIDYKERYDTHRTERMEAATKHLDKITSTHEDVKMKLEECSMRANSGRFSLRDLLMVPMQRVLKYHLLLQELVKHTVDQQEKENLRTALDAMRDLAQCVNEVKRDNEIIRQITTFQLCIENMSLSLALYGRPKIDGEFKICNLEKKSKQDRCVVREKDSKKWTHTFLLMDLYGQGGYDLFFKTRELKKKWLEQFEMALSNMCPENSTANGHDFQMHCFEDTTSCKACQMLLRGIFYQGYRCSRCKMAAHKECLGRVPACGRNSELSGTLKKNKTMRLTSQRQTKPGKHTSHSVLTHTHTHTHTYTGVSLDTGELDASELLNELLCVCVFQGRNLTIREVGWFPCSKVQPFVPAPPPDLTGLPWFAGNMDRAGAKTLLMSRSDGTFLVRQKDAGEFAISLKFSMDTRHIKVTYSEGFYRINEKKAFKGLFELVQYYQENSLRECFKDVDSRLQTPYNQPEQSAAPQHSSTRHAGVSERYHGTAKVRYDFSARDRTELSLREGDTVKIISKKAHNGWWKGEVYGRVGLFPSNYVEEEHSDYC
ncbi:proto-oncogene vav-like [Sinocyclocheilus rhinocerous]|uniref:proto-oncogene vav-like n=1 Tax=Sinocyclocheilus rhinocerous TaxID=307959 RepID=UPI0007B87EDA|nr:PREDICTED: proto-oncogene vav-like [Sinocyclocheilus rhinocerous]